MADIDKEEIKKMFSQEYSYPLIERIADNSTACYEYKLDFEAFRSILIFPWNHWPLFRHLNDLKLLGPASKLKTLPLQTVLQYKKQFEAQLNDKAFYIRMKKLEDSMLANGYVDDGRLLLASETITKKDLYAIDGNHRMLAYLELIESGKVRYSRLSCIIAEVTNIANLFKDSTHTIR